jgi:hypothetical protein
MKTRHCSEAEKLIVAELDEGLNPSQQERLENHLRECAPCSRVREETFALLSSIASDLPEEPGEEFWRLYNQSLNAKLKEQESKPVWSFWWKAAGVFVSAILALVVIRVATLQPGDPQIAARYAMSPDVILELEQVYGPTSEELPPTSVYGDQLFSVVDARSDDNYEQWFEVEDESGPLYL